MHFGRNVLNRNPSLATATDVTVLWSMTVRVKAPMVVKLVTGLFVLIAIASPQDTSLPLVVPAGVPLRLYLTKRVSKRIDAPVEAKLLTPLYAFDHEVIPAGTQVFGHVSRNSNRFRDGSGSGLSSEVISLPSISRKLNSRTS